MPADFEASGKDDDVGGVLGAGGIDHGVACDL
jgi:hypothetical protein